MSALLVTLSLAVGALSAPESGQPFWWWLGSGVAVVAAGGAPWWRLRRRG